MSFCRFSTNDFQCDLYCYEDCNGGFTTHIAKRRPIFTEPLPEPVEFKEGKVAAWMVRHNKVMEMVMSCEFVTIDLPYSGQRFNDATVKEFCDRLIELRSIGYIFPFHIIDELSEAETIKPEADIQTPPL